MNFSEQSFDDDLNIISSYENDSICIKKKKYYGNLLIPAKGSIKEINKNFKDDLSSSLNKIDVNKFDLFIIGYNKNPNDLDWLTEKIKKLGFGYEIMNHNSLYHTHNILIADNRQFYSIIIKS